MEYLSDKDRFHSYFERRLQNDPSILQDAINKTMEKNAVPSSQRKIIFQMMKVNYPKSLIAIKPLFSPMIGKMKIELPEKMKDGVKDGHIKALLKSIAPPIRVEYYDKLNYEIIEDKNACFILGDSILIFQFEDGKYFRPYSDRHDKMIALYLPLTPTRVLIGSNTKAVKIPQDINKTIAQCSLEYFIASKNTDQHQLLQTCIGDLAAAITPFEIEAILSEMIHGNLIKSKEG